jgi:cytochrome c oxidase subunit I+III
MFGHPWVYIIVLPAISMATEALTTFCRRPLIGYRFVAMSAVATTILGFGVWVHHMFGTGVSPLVMTFFGASSMAIAIPTGISVFAWLVTIWFGRPIITTSFLYVVGFIVLLVIGGVSGVMTASVPFDWQLTDTYFVVAHLHYVLLGINVFPAIAALFYWFPKMTGRLLDERLGRVSFWTLFVGTNVVFFPMHIVGMLGMPRRVWTYPDGLGWGGWNMLETIGAFMVAAGVMLVVWNVAASLVRGERAGANPWGAPTLEWATPSPAPAYNFAVIPTVASRYPLWDDASDGKGSKIHEGPALSEGHQVLETTPLDARPARVLHMPGDSWSPITVSAMAMLCCCGLLVGNNVLAAAGGLGVAAGLVVWLWPGLEEAVAPANGADVGREREPRSLAWWGMAGLIATEAALFAFLLFSYFYLGSVQQAAWPPRGMPELTLPLVNTGLLIASSVVLSWGHRGVEKESRIRLRAGLGGTLLLGVAFLSVQAVEYAHRTAGPGTDAYASIFYVLTGFHGMHVLVGLVMLGTLLARGLRSGSGRGDIKSVRAVSMYWHFVDIVWLAVFATLYLSPRL